jgi:hypothetical protein
LEFINTFYPVVSIFNPDFALFEIIVARFRIEILTAGRSSKRINGKEMNEKK